MGQYYHGVILKQNFRTSYKNEEAEVILSPHDYGMGLKLMETAWWKILILQFMRNFWQINFMVILLCGVGIMLMISV